MEKAKYDDRPIGVFDSGLGGLSVVRHLLSLLPHEDIVYFGDTGRVPYGSRSTQIIRRYAREDCAFLLGRDVKCIVAACGTVSSVAGDLLAALPVPATGIVGPTAAAAVAATRSGRIGVLGTLTTVNSGSFSQEMRKLRPNVQVTSTACPIFVPLVENGWIDPDDEVTALTAERYLKDLRAAQVDTAILGCTHFPLLAPIIGRELGADVTLIDPGRETAGYVRRMLAADGLLSARETPGSCRFFVTDRPQDFSRVAEIFLGRAVHEEVETIAPEQLPGAAL